MMIYQNVIFGVTNSDLVEINKNELAARLKCDVDISNEAVSSYIKIFNENVTYRYAYIKIPFSQDNNMCYFGNSKVESKSLSIVLNGSKDVYLMAVTSGISIDKLIAKYSLLNPVASFYMDAIASAAIESYADYINEEICKNLNTTKRFSPGYADFPLEFQKSLLEYINAKETLGIELTKDLLMIPRKSITAVIGVK